MKRKKKLKYVDPTLKVINIKMEEALCAGSSKINPGSNNSSTVPNIESWEHSGLSENKDFDL